MGKRRNRNRNKAASGVECTCSMRDDLDPPRHLDHENHCDLWHLGDFCNGLRDWDPVTQKLFWTGGAVGVTDDEGWYDDVPCAPSDMQAIIDATVSGYSLKGGGWSKYGGNYQSCRHNMTKVVLPDTEGTVVHCSASTDVRGRVNRPDYGVYLANSWTPQAISTFVPWEDYGTPYVPWRAVREVVQDFYAKARAGVRVEVGCMGGHGRTGTFLAAVVMLADPNMSPEGAVAWVRSNYCHKAVEDRSQDYWLKWFADPSLPAHYDRPAPKLAAKVVGAGVTPKGGPVPGGNAGDSCNWQKKGKWCRHDFGHTGPHHYILPARRFVDMAYVAPEGLRCDKTMSGGKYQCRKQFGHTDYHSYTAAPAEAPVKCDKGFSGPCTLDAGHDRACLVMAPVHEYCDIPTCDRYFGHAGEHYMSVSRDKVSQ